MTHRVHNYSILLDPPTRRLFPYVDSTKEKLWAAIARTDFCQRWWRQMAEIMPSNPDGSPVAETLHEVFHLD